MTPNEIPFSSETPKEAGVYLWKQQLYGEPEPILIQKRETSSQEGVSKPDLFVLFRGTQLRNLNRDWYGYFSPKLIPATALDEAQKRIEELETRLGSVETKLGPLCYQISPSVFHIREALQIVRGY